eukprot:12499.XXX_850958_851119_1 [CDS] Oithona nana genome sequencing.
MTLVSPCKSELFILFNDSEEEMSNLSLTYSKIFRSSSKVNRAKRVLFPLSFFK